MSASLSTPMTAKIVCGLPASPHNPVHESDARHVCLACLGDAANLCVAAHDPGRSPLVCSLETALSSLPDLTSSKQTQKGCFWCHIWYAAVSMSCRAYQIKWNLVRHNRAGLDSFFSQQHVGKKISLEGSAKILVDICTELTKSLVIKLDRLADSLVSNTR